MSLHSHGMVVLPKELSIKETIKENVTFLEFDVVAPGAKKSDGKYESDTYQVSLVVPNSELETFKPQLQPMEVFLIEDAEQKNWNDKIRLNVTTRNFKKIKGGLNRLLGKE